MALGVQVSEDRRLTLLAGEERISLRTPEEDLIDCLSFDYSDYRQEIQRLREAHPLFQPKRDVPVSDLEDLTAEALLLPAMLREIDPVGYRFVADGLDRVLRREDDGLASFLLETGAALLDALEEPVLTQVRLRNIFEVTFDGTERMAQRERLDLLREIYPDVARLCDPSQVREGAGMYGVGSLFGFRLLELALYFKQERKRIARCDYCWGYFIPKTGKATRYCDRIFDGQSCKRRGANQQRREEKDAALTKCDQLRDRMLARMLRYENTIPENREHLAVFTEMDYVAWSANAVRLRREYLDGKHTAEEFLRLIDTAHALDSYEVEQIIPEDEETVWQKRVRSDLDFDPAREYFPIQVLDLGEQDPQWGLRTAEDQIREDQQGHQSLREKYRKK